MRTLGKLMMVAAAVSCCQSAAAQTIGQPVYTLVESGKKVYGRASQDFRGIGVVDYWWVGHDPSDGPFMALAGATGQYSPEQSFSLPNVAIDGSNMDRHQCGFMHLNDDNKIDMVCTLGADRGKGNGPNEVYRNDSTDDELRMTRIDGEMLPTGLEDLTGRHRSLEPFRFADGTQGVWDIVYGIPRDDGLPNVNRLFRYEGSGSFKFTEVPSPPINITTLYNCSRTGDLNGDGLDDLLLCRNEVASLQAADSVLYLQNPDGSFTESAMPMAFKQFRTAEIADLNGDGRQDLVVSVTQGRKNRIEIYYQDETNHLPATPALTAVVSGNVNSLAVGDLDGDGKPDIYAAISNAESCRSDFDLTRRFKDTWKDLVLSTAGAGPAGFVGTVMTNEPRQRGCSWIATWAGPGLVHLGRGLEGAPGDNYSLRFAPVAGR